MQNIKDYYTKAQNDYELLWHLKSKMALHYGLWAKSTKNLRQALDNSNKLVMRLGQISEKSSVADFGCGIGGTVIYLYKHTRAALNGVSISEYQIQQAQQLKLKNNCEPVVFTYQDYCHTNFESESFDVVYAIESSCYAFDKTDFLKEAFRVLKKNGRLIVLDFFWNDVDKETQLKYLDKKMQFAQTWQINDFERATAFQNKLGLIGFNYYKKIRLDKYVKPSVNRLKLFYYPGIICHYFLSFFGKRGEIERQNVLSTKLQAQLFEQNIWSYYLFFAQK